jgi:hypothetical protein
LRRLQLEYWMVLVVQTVTAKSPFLINLNN